ncbi:MAG: type II toxin-antitoxin system CcdA family antitoxin [Pyrobaculum sp.]
MSWVTVSTKVRRVVVEKARRYGINISEFLRRALEEEVKRREAEEMAELAVRVSEDLKKASTLLGGDSAVRSTREDRDGR